MSYFWVITDKGKGCYMAENMSQAIDEIEQWLGQRVIEINALPYPAEPKLIKDQVFKMPAFCMQPEKCKGKSSCQREWVCND